MSEISPELVLVDPELAAEARALLPEPPQATPAQSARLARRAQQRRARGRRRLASVVLVGAVAATAAVAYAVVPRVDEKPSLAPAATLASPPASAQQPATPARPQPQPPAAPRPQPQAPPPPVSVLGARKKAAPPSPTPPPAPARTRPPGAPSRLYVWAPVEGAVFYQVAFVRNGELFHAAQTADAWLRVPDSLKFTPGRYRWSVRPAIAGDSGIVVADAVVVRTFRVADG